MEHVIPLWRILAGTCLLIAVLFASSILVCGTNQMCRSRIPTLSNLLDSVFVSPFLVTALNAVLSLHMFTSVSLYYKTGSRLGMLSAFLVYVSVVITMFVFPFTDWSRNWANVTIIVTLLLWMMITTISLKHFYRHRLDSQKSIMYLSGAIVVLYATSSIAYIVCRAAVASETALLVTEIFSGFGVAGFLILCVAHIWDLQFKIHV